MSDRLAVSRKCRHPCTRTRSTNIEHLANRIQLLKRSSNIFEHLVNVLATHRRCHLGYLTLSASLSDSHPASSRASRGLAKQLRSTIAPDLGGDPKGERSHHLGGLCSGARQICPLRRRDHYIVVCFGVCIGCASEYASSDHPFRQSG